MKKILLTILLVMAGQTSFASCEAVNCVAPYDLTSGFSRFVSNITGQNFIAEKIGESLTKKAIKKNITDGDISVNLNSFSTRDLKAGRFKSLEIAGKDINISGIYISDFNIKTLCDFNYVAHDNNNNYSVKENIPAAFTAVITEQDLNKTMDSSDYKRLIDDINSIGGSLNIFRITSADVKLKNGQIYYILHYALPFMRKSKEIVIRADLSVENGRIVFSEPDFVNNNEAVNAESFSNILNYINPLDFSAKILENKDANFNIENIKISDGKITVNGKITVLKDKE